MIKIGSIRKAVASALLITSMAVGGYLTASSAAGSQTVTSVEGPADDSGWGTPPAAEPTPSPTQTSSDSGWG